MAFGDKRNTPAAAAEEIRALMRSARFASTYITQRCRALVTTHTRAAIAAELNGDGAAMLDLYNKLEAFRAAETGTAIVPLP